ncbi:MAG: AMP-binding protein, partial [Myxococcales bacterium]|nr:AMP-binding protein [Myxococcales bacterium]
LGNSIFIFEGAFNFPSAARLYQLIEQHKISVLYTAPTAVRMLMAAGEEYKGQHDISSLRLLGSVGEPINPEAWSWYKRVLGEDRCDIVDTWWQTETGAIMMSAVPDIDTPKAGSASKAFFAIDAEIISEQGELCKNNETGYLLIKKPWPSLARGIWGDQERFLQSYFDKFPGAYFTGDGAYFDLDKDIHINGRIDDVVNISGHRLGTAEVESALVAHAAIAEAAVVGIHDDVTGQRLVAFVSLMPNVEPSDGLEEQLKEQVKNCIGSFAKPAAIHFRALLPKTRSGKIMRRLLRSIARGEEVKADITTLEDSSALTTT